MKKQYDFSAARRGPVVAEEAGKTRITIRIDDAVLDWFRQRVNEAGGGNYQTMINVALREHIGLHDENLDDRVRRLIREELGRKSPPAKASARPAKARRVAEPRTQHTR